MPSAQRDTPEWHSWRGMRARCNNPLDRSYPNYGGRGISVHPSWASFAQFYADMGPRPAGTTLDRIDNDGNYEPGNCRWATHSEQNANRRSLTTCRRGHERNEENTYVFAGRSHCRPCGAINHARRRDAKAATPGRVRSIESIEDSGPFATLTREVDLDDLMLDLAVEYVSNGYIDVWNDDETSLPGYEGSEAIVGWFRKTFCTCGEGHAWDLMHHGDEKPEGNKSRGTVLGVWFA